MAKRFTDTDRWKKGLLRGLQGAYKLLWIYINDECNHAGIWVVDWDVAVLRTGLNTISFEKARDALSPHIIDLGEEWFIPSFLEEQYNGELNPDNKVHASIIKILRAKNIPDSLYLSKTGENEAPSMGRASPLQGAKEKEYDKDTGIGSVEDKGSTGRARKKSKPSILFSESEVASLDAFEAAFAGTDYEGFNLHYYHQAILNWSASEGKRKIDWVAAARNWMMRDARDGRAAMKGTDLINQRNGKPTAKAIPGTASNPDYERRLAERLQRLAGQGEQSPG